jgi:hypothetical protein
MRGIVPATGRAQCNECFVESHFKRKRNGVTYHIVTTVTRHLLSAKFQVITAASSKFRFVFWDVLPYKIIVDRRFRGTCCLHHQGDDNNDNKSSEHLASKLSVWIYTKLTHDLSGFKCVLTQSKRHTGMKHR